MKTTIHWNENQESNGTDELLERTLRVVLKGEFSVHHEKEKEHKDDEQATYR